MAKAKSQSEFRCKGFNAGHANPYLKDFSAELADSGYTRLSIYAYEFAVVHFDEWLQRQAVPTIPQWRLCSMPRYLSPPDVDRVVTSCNLKTPVGVRDRAVLLLLVRLGLRAGDIVALRINDIDWRAGTLRVAGKGRRETRLPMPQDVGDALLDHLRNARARVALDRVFLRVPAPSRPFKTSACVSDIVCRALRRARIENPPSKGANLLRHSAATSMLRGGATLDAISAVLRHRSPDMTGYYAKVDLAMLQTVAQPWPEGTPC